VVSILKDLVYDFYGECLDSHFVSVESEQLDRHHRDVPGGNDSNVVLQANSIPCGSMEASDKGLLAFW
jgi:hypothetical protein